MPAKDCRRGNRQPNLSGISGSREMVTVDAALVHQRRWCHAATWLHDTRDMFLQLRTYPTAILTESQTKTNSPSDRAGACLPKRNDLPRVGLAPQEAVEAVHAPDVP